MIIKRTIIRGVLFRQRTIVLPTVLELFMKGELLQSSKAHFLCAVDFKRPHI